MNLTSLVTCLLLLGAASAQDCSTLSVNRTESSTISGAILNVCEFDGDQCCTQNYLDGVRNSLERALLNGLREEFEGGIDTIDAIFGAVANFFESDFIGMFASNFPFANLIGNTITQVLQNFMSLLSRARFLISEANPEDIATSIFSDIISAFDSFLPFNDEQNQCVVELLTRSINQTAMAVQAQSLQNLRRSYTAISRIIDFLRQFNGTLGGFSISNFPTGCVERFINISFCSRCRGIVPPICSNTCNGLVRGCFAAFYSGLNREFNNLWSVVGEIVDQIQEDIVKLLEADFLLESSLSVTSLITECGITIPPFGKRQADDLFSLPEAVTNGVQNLRGRGVFKYGSNGPRFCRILSNEVNFCRDQSGSTDSSRSCSSNVACTSTCNCWNGTAMSVTNTLSFTGSSIAEQADNPYFKDSVESYEAAAASLMVPVNQFLTSDEFSSVTPEGVTIPEPAPFGGSVAPTVSMVMVVGAILFSVLSM